MTLYQKFKNLEIDHSVIGLEQSDSRESYYCTPKDAEILGWAGTDGIHYCTIPAFGEMVFAVSPMNFGDCVHPIARSFEDLLRLLLGGAGMDALEQCYAWDEEQFKAFLADCPASGKQQAVLEVIRNEFHLEPMENPFSYVKQLQDEFDLLQIPYTEDFYDADMNPAAPMEPAEWKVTYDGGFWNTEGDAGVAAAIDKTFCWGNEKWIVPAVYFCAEGLVIDYFMEADPVQVKAFIDKWDLYHEERSSYTKEQREQIEREHPLNTDFRGEVTYNGYKLKMKHGCGLTWPSKACVPADYCPETEAIRVLQHYGLDLDKAWSIHRCAYEWGDCSRAAGQEPVSLSVRMVRNPERIAGQRFSTPAAGESISLTHPLTGCVYVLTVHEVGQQELPEHAFRDSDMEYPTHFTVMNYSLEPDITGSGFMIQDCAEGDRPKLKKRGANAFEPAAVSAAAVGIIGGADGPTAIITGQNSPRLHAACSSLHFTPVEEAEWRAVFSEKLMDDVDVTLV